MTEAERIYGDIIHLPHHVSSWRVQMPVKDRAAQFAPFAALTGYEEAVAETSRLTTHQTELDEHAVALLDNKLRFLADHPGTKVELTYFVPDERKDGGQYVTASGQVSFVDGFSQKISLENGQTVKFSDLRGVVILEKL